MASLKKTNEVQRQMAAYQKALGEAQQKYQKDTASTQTRNYEAEAVKSIKEQIQLTEKLAKVKKEIDKTDDETQKAKLTNAQNVYTAQLSAQEALLAKLKQEAPELEDSAAVKKELANLALKRAQAEGNVNDKLDDNNGKLKQHETLLSKVVDTVTRMATIWASQAMTKFWSDGLEYASSYYDKMNEIRIVTGMSEGDS